MVKFFAMRIMRPDSGTTIDNIPERFKEDVLKYLEEVYNADGYGKPLPEKTKEDA